MLKLQNKNAKKGKLGAPDECRLMLATDGEVEPMQSPSAPLAGLCFGDQKVSLPC